MARIARLKYHDPRDGYYHIISRTVLKSFLLDDEARETFLGILRMLSRVYFVKVVTFSLMSNHFHLIVRMLPSEEISDNELKERFHVYYNEGKPKVKCRSYYTAENERFRRRFSDLSRFIQDLKQRFSRWYNKKMENQGHVWSDRFRSVMLEDGRALLACMVYVELNSVRAGLAQRPEEFRYCGINHFVTGGRAASWLDHETLTRTLSAASLAVIHPAVSGDDNAVQSVIDTSRRSEINQYLSIVYREGMIETAGKIKMSQEIGEKALADNFSEVGIYSLLSRWHHFSAGLFIGSKDFCMQRFNEFRSFFQTTKDRSAHRIGPKKLIPDGSFLDLHSMRKLH